MKENYLCKNDWVQGCSQFYFLLRFLLPQRQRVARLGDERCLCKLGAHPKQKKKLSACVEGRELKGIPQSLHTTIGWSTGSASGNLFPASRAGSLQVAHGSIHLAAGRCTVLMRRANVSVLRSIALSAPYNFISFGAAPALKSRATMDSLSALLIRIIYYKMGVIEKTKQGNPSLIVPSEEQKAGNSIMREQSRFLMV